MKKVVLIVLLVAFASGLAGCWGHHGGGHGSGYGGGHHGGGYYGRGR